MALLGGGASLVSRSSDAPAQVRDAAVPAPDGDAVADAPGGTLVPPSVDRPTCADGGDGCFRWVIGLDHDVEDVAVGGGVVVAQAPAAGLLTAWDLRDGSPLWQHDVDGQQRSDPIVVPELLLHRVDDVLVGRDLGDGAERWRVRIGPTTTVAAEHVDGIVVVAAETAPAEDASDPRPAGLAVGIDASTGTVLWQVEGWRAALAAGGAAIVTTTEGRVAAIEPRGETRWEVDPGLDRARDGHALAHGHVVYVFAGGNAAPELRSLRSGAVMELSGGGVVSDGEHTLLIRMVDDVAWEYVLVAEDGPVWRSAPVQLSGCDGPVLLQPDEVILTTCDGARLTLDRADGAEVSRAPAPRTRGYSPEDGYRVGWFGPFQLRDTDPMGGRGDLLIVDTRDDGDVATLPPGTGVVTADYRDRPTEVDGVVVFGSDRWLTALEVPPDEVATAG